MQKAHDSAYNNYWRNYPNPDTPIVQDQLNRIETTIDTMDDREIVLDTTKANQIDLLQSIRSVTFDESSGVFTFTKFNGTTFQINTPLEKVVTNFYYDSNPESAHYQNLVLTLEDGSTQYVDMTSLITQYEFTDSSTIRWIIDGDGEIQAEIIAGSITQEKLNPDYLAQLTTQANRASQNADSAGTSAIESRSYSEGGTGTREGEDTDNSKYYAQVAQDTVADLLANFGISVVGTRLVFGSEFESQFGISVVGTRLIFTEV